MTKARLCIDEDHVVDGFAEAGSHAHERLALVLLDADRTRNGDGDAHVREQRQAKAHAAGREAVRDLPMTSNRRRPRPQSPS